MVSVVKRQSAAHHFVHNDTDAPPIYRSAVIVVFEYFWGEILRRTAKRFGGPSFDIGFRVNIYLGQVIL